MYNENVFSHFNNVDKKKKEREREEKKEKKKRKRREEKGRQSTNSIFVANYKLFESIVVVDFNLTIFFYFFISIHLQLQLQSYLLDALPLKTNKQKDKL